MAAVTVVVVVAVAARRFDRCGSSSFDRCGGSSRSIVNDDTGETMSTFVRHNSMLDTTTSSNVVVTMLVMIILRGLFPSSFHLRFKQTNSIHNNNNNNISYCIMSPTS